MSRKDQDETTRIPAVWAPGAELGHCKIVRFLGAGGMGEVYVAEDTSLGRQVALKLLSPDRAADPDARARFEREARAMAAVSHPSVVTIHEVAELGGRPYLVMEYVEGQTLQEVLEAGRVPLDRVLELAVQLAAGLAKVHERGIVHRDIKPSNIIVDEDGRPHLLDFGLATTREAEEVTQVGEALGTIRYMSPEQAEGKIVDRRSDLFAFGILLYEMIAGRPPFRGDSIGATVRAILQSDPEPLERARADVPEALARLVERLLEKDPRRRPADAVEVVQTIRELGGSDIGTLVSRSFAAARPSPSIAVLPLENMSADPEQEYFCDGMTEELITALSKVEGLHVPARTSSFAFKGKTVDVREVGRTLHVGAVLEGSVRKAGNRLRITVQLVDVTDGYEMWTERYDRDLEDVFAIQDEVTLAIVDRLKPQLLGDARQWAGERPVGDVEAYNLLLKGRFFANKRTDEGMRKAVDYFRQCVEVDPAYALGYAEMAFAYLALAGYAVVPPAEGYALARRSVERAAKIDPDLALVHCVQGVLDWEQGRDAVAAERKLRRGLELSPDDQESLTVLSELCLALGRFDEAIELAGRASEVDPLSPVAAMRFANTLFEARRFDEAEQELSRTRELDPEFLPGLAQTALVAVERGRIDDALVAADRAAALAPDHPMYVATRGYVNARAGRTDTARAVLCELERIAESRYVPAFELALVHVGLGQSDAAFRELERAVGESYWRVLFLRVDPRLDPIRTDPRFERLVKRVALGD